LSPPTFKTVAPPLYAVEKISTVYCVMVKLT